MRPVELRLSGLHSYREEQVVDFAALCAHGIFGIFGATGSGKSTLLDAIILALFGEVPRASHGTQGIINQRLDEARVAFTFDLGRGAERRRYRVERVLRRSGEFGAATARCRLVLLDGPAERVLAEKDGQVKGALREIVGLNASDFTRAVVLPQGRFAEFLTLTPALRREMMERLFELERFGEKLRQRTDAALGEAQEALGRVRAEQEGLGNCSPAAVAQARRELEASRAAARQAGDAYRAALRRREEAAAVVQLQERRDAYRRRLAELEGREAEVALLEAKLGAAERAEGLRSLLEQQDRLQEDLFRRRELLAALARREEEAAAAAARAAEEAAARRRHRATEEPRLVEERGRLEAARAEEAELDGWLQEERSAREELRRVQAEEAALGEKCGDLARQREEAEARRAGLERQLAELWVDPEEMERAVQARNLAREIERLVGEKERLGAACERLRRDLEKDRTAAEGLRQELVRLAEEKGTLREEERRLLAGAPPDEEELARRGGELGAWQAAVARLAALAAEKERARAALAQLQEEETSRRAVLVAREGSLASLAAAAERAAEALRRAREALERARQRNMAAYLAGMLEGGAPCPVCGSRVHPAPAAATTADLEPYELAVREAEEAEAQHREAREAKRAEVEALRAGLEGLAPQKEHRQREIERLEGEEAACRNQLPAAWLAAAGEDPAALEALWRREGEAHEEAVKARQAWRQRREELRQAGQDLTRREGELQAKLVRAQTAADGTARRLAEEEERAQAAAAEEARRRGELAPLLAALGVPGPEAVEQHYGRLQRRQQEYRQRWKEAGAAQEEARRLEAAEGEARAAWQAVLTDRRVREARLGELAARIARRQEDLDRLTGGRRVAEALAGVEQKLAALQAGVEAAEREEKEATEEARRARAEREAEEKVFRDAETHLAALASRLEQAVRGAHFATAGEARDALLPAAEREELRRRVGAYRQDLEVARRGLAEVEAQLGGREIAAGAWEQIQADVRAAEEAWQEAQRREGAAANALRELEARQERWQALEQERLRLSRRRELLEELGRLLRGRALVEFVALHRLENLAQLASERLGRLTGYRYALELDGQGGFVLRDDHNGGRRRPVFTLSGGETFLASLALALALSDQIQRRGRAPLEFFFLDEGFGSLDEECLATVMDTLERLPLEQVTIGLITHVPQVYHRLPRRLVVEAASAGRGSRVRLE